MFNASFKVATVWGIPIKLHVSLLLLLAVLAAPMVRGRLGWEWLVFVVALQALMLVSIALHELGHSFVALRTGCRVREITLLCIGGVAQMEQIPRRPRDEFIMAIAGPAVSIVLGISMLWLGNRVAPWLLTHGGAMSELAPQLLPTVGAVNVVLAMFNLLPAFPMDGGRVLRALLTSRLGRLRATFIASRLGRIVAILFGLIGYFGLGPLFPAMHAPNWMLIIIAFFIFNAAGAEYRAEKRMAAHQGYGGWRPADSGWQPGEARDDEVIVSPPPYESGPDRKVGIQPDEADNPLSRLFGQGPRMG